MISELVRVPGGALIHPTAVLDPGAQVGAGTRIWHFCHVMAGARVGRDGSFGQGCFIGDGAVVGDRVRVQNHVSVFSGVELQDDVFVGPHVVFTNVRRPRADTSRRHAYAKTTVAVGATVGANATVLPGVAIGRAAFVGAGTVVTRDVAPYALVLGSPARQVGWVSAAGASLVFDARGQAVCCETGRRYELVGGEVRAIPM